MRGPVAVKLGRAPRTVEIHPPTAGIKVEIQCATFRFPLPHTMNLSVEIDGGWSDPLLVSTNPELVDPPRNEFGNAKRRLRCGKTVGPDRDLQPSGISPVGL